MADTDFDRSRQDQITELARLIKGCRHRLFAQHMDPMLDAVFQDRQMGIGIGRDNENIDIRICQIFLIVVGIAVCLISFCELMSKIQVLVHDSADTDIFPIINICDVFTTNMTAADQHNSICFFHSTITRILKLTIHLCRTAAAGAFFIGKRIPSPPTKPF